VTYLRYLPLLPQLFALLDEVCAAAADKRFTPEELEAIGHRVLKLVGKGAKVKS
jgi:hypothetical protein